MGDAEGGGRPPRRPRRASRASADGAHDRLLGERADERAAEHPVAGAHRRRRRRPPRPPRPPARCRARTAAAPCIWYSPATSSTSGKLTAAACDAHPRLARAERRRRRRPRPRTTSGAPSARGTSRPARQVTGPATTGVALLDERERALLGVLAAEHLRLQLARRCDQRAAASDTPSRTSSFVALHARAARWRRCARRSRGRRRAPRRRGTTAFTSPTATARAASIVSPVSVISSAMPSGIRVPRNVPPPPANRPRFTSGSPTCAPSATTMTSQPSSSSSPPATAVRVGRADDRHARSRRSRSAR